MQKTALIATLFVMGAILGGIIYVYIRSPGASESPGAAITNVTPAPNAPTPTPYPQTTVLNTAELPLGDGRISNGPKKRYIYSCQTTFTSAPSSNDPWIHGDTWDANQKPVVSGSVPWPKATLDIHILGAIRFIIGDALPYQTQTGEFPATGSADKIVPQSLSFELSNDPTVAKTASCVPANGIVGMAANGVPIYSGINQYGQDAMAHDSLDSCSGHPDSTGLYHYYDPIGCVPGAAQNNTLIGFAMDGFGIYSMFGQNGKEITNADLDECHGTTGEVPWNGRTVNMYHYVVTREYPYTVGCFKGSPIRIKPKEPVPSATSSATPATSSSSVR